MKAFTFQAPPNILFEPGASSKLAEIVGGYGVSRVLLVTDKGVRNAGLTRGTEAALKDGGFTLSVFDDVEADCLRLAAPPERNRPHKKSWWRLP
jgi:alcohol dehydrogenase class IV